MRKMMSNSTKQSEFTIRNLNSTRNIKLKTLDTLNSSSKIDISTKLKDSQNWARNAENSLKDISMTMEKPKVSSFIIKFKYLKLLTYLSLIRSRINKALKTLKHIMKLKSKIQVMNNNSLWKKELGNLNKDNKSFTVEIKKSPKKHENKKIGSDSR